MTRRERLERKVERRREWADKAAARSDARFASVRRLADSIPLGQPILVGHHSERRARKDADRIHTGMGKAVELAKLADSHEAKATGLEAQLERSVFSDDADAIEQLERRIKEHEETAAKINAVNRAWRKGGRDEVARLFGDRLADTAAETMKQCPWLRSPLDATSDRAAIRRDRERIEQIKRESAKRAEAEAAPGGVVVKQAGDFAVVTFAEKPERDVLDALRAAGFRWGAGSWVGDKAKLPVCVIELATKERFESMVADWHEKAAKLTSTEEPCPEHGIEGLTNLGVHGIGCGPCADRELAEAAETTCRQSGCPGSLGGDHDGRCPKYRAEG